MQIDWIQCRSYDEAKNYSGAIYLHERDGKPFYWGKADDCAFGVRYNPGYKHWIEGSLASGGRLYIGRLDAESRARIDDVERHLIRRYPTLMNKQAVAPSGVISIRHAGDVPPFVPAEDR